MKKFLNINKKFKNNKGSITSFTLLSMLFFLIVVIAIYASVNTKVQKQQKELNTIQKSYEQQEQINDIYEKKYDDYINSETSTIQVYADTNLKGEVKGQKKNTLGTVYTNVAQNKIKIFGGANSTYAYSETADGKRTVLSGNEITIQATTSGKTIYTWVKGEDGEYTKYYTAVTVKLSTLQDKTIYVAEGKSTDIEINGENKGKITYSQIDTSYISIENNKVTGIKAGDTTITATESNGGAQAKITIKIVKLTLEKTKGITTVGDNKKIQVSGINNGTISAKSNDETIAKVTVSGNELTIIPQKVGNTKIIITESNAGANIEYEIQVVGITLAPNGGTYTMPTTGKATIKTKVNVENASKIEVAWTSENLEWKTIENNSEIIKNNCEQGTYYLYVKADNEYLYQSQAFIVGEERISINITTAEWTNKDITATIEYPNITVANTRKAGYGTTLADAQISASSSTAPTTSLTATANGYVYATAEDNAGNVITTSVQITNIDKEAPTMTTLAIDSTEELSENITITAQATDNASGIVAYQWSTNSGLTDSSGGWTSITNTKSQITQTYTATVNGTYYFYVKDMTGNIGKASIKISNICTWEEIAQIAKVISNTSTITDDSEIATVTVDGIEKTLKVGQVKYLDGKKVRILGFNHDELAETYADYGKTYNTAGISFEYVDSLIKARMNSSDITLGGWKDTELRGTLNETTYNSLSIKSNIKKVKKDYIPTYNVASTQQTEDYLWLLSCGEIWNNGYNGGATRGFAITTEGKQYKYYKINLGSTSYITKSPVTKKPIFNNWWWLRSPESDRYFCGVYSGGCNYIYPSYELDAAPGFSI